MSNLNKIFIVFIVSFVVLAAFGIKTETHDRQIVSAAAATAPPATPTPAPAPTRPLTAKEQTFIDQACADSVNQSMYDTCKTAILNSWAETQ